MAVVLRECTLEDVAALREVSIETFSDTFGAQNSPEHLEVYLERAYNPDQLREELANPNTRFFFLYSDGELAGYVKLNINEAQTEEIAPDGLEVERIYIRTKFKRRGFGQQLIDKAIEAAQRLERKSIWLGVWEENPNAIAFYERMGFSQVGAHSFFMGDDEQTDYIMQKELS